MIFRTFLISSTALFVVAGPAHGDGRDFELPAAEMGDSVADGGLELHDVDFVGNPLKRFAERWLDDLVIAPVPGRSPQVGWTLALGGGYFPGPRDEDSDVAQGKDGTEYYFGVGEAF